MRFSANRRGAMLTAAQLFIIGLIPFAVTAYFFNIIGAALIVIWAALCLALFFRLNRLNVTLDKNILRVEKGKWFPLVLRVPVTYITGVHVFQTPLARKLKVCYVVVYTSGLSFILLGINFNDASLLAALASRGGTM